MGAGKSTVGRRIAERHALGFVDLDDALGDVPAIWSALGETGFRRVEREALARAALGGGVLAVGGGALLLPGGTELLRGWRIVVLSADVDALRARIGGDPRRPLASRLDAVVRERAAHYASLGPIVPTDGLTPDEVADRVEASCGWR